MIRKTTPFRIPALLVLTTTGCSLLFVNGPPEGHQEMTEITCTEQKGLPILEAVFGGLFFLGALVTGEDFSPSGAIMAGAGGLFGTSAYVGNRRVNQCRAALEELRQRRTVPRSASPSSGAR